MHYVQQSLGDHEELIHMGEFHWMHTFTAFFSIVMGFVFSIGFLAAVVTFYKMSGQFNAQAGVLQALPYLHIGLRGGAFLIFMSGVLRFVSMLVQHATTEIAVTNKRLIYKTGLLSRHVGEISIDRVEGVNVLQSVMGRLLGYGRVAIRGMGVGEIVMPPIDKPIAFRRAIQRARGD